MNKILQVIGKSFELKYKPCYLNAGNMPVPKEGLEPSRAQCSLSPEPSASANSATSACILHDQGEKDFTCIFRFVNLEQQCYNLHSSILWLRLLNQSFV